MEAPDRILRPRSGMISITLALAAKGIFCCLLVLMVVQTWAGVITTTRSQSTINAWGGTDAYAVFYPIDTGDDETLIKQGDNSVWIAVARDLYPLLDSEGAVFIDASNYAPGVPQDPELPTSLIRVNTNYLERYPILDQSGNPIQIDPDDSDWVIAIPEQYRAHESEISILLQQSRVAAFRAEKSIVGDQPPDRFANQAVRIVWMESGQRIFSFNSAVNPDQGNMITDPIIEIMTSNNSMASDRLNSITGSLNTPLKVRVDGDPSVVFQRLVSDLRQLHLDDNLQHLVTPSDAMLEQLGKLQGAIRWYSFVAVAALLIMLVLSVTIVSIFCDRHRKSLTVRRLLGVGFVRTHRELVILLSVTWFGQALIAFLVFEALTQQRVPQDLAIANQFSPEVWQVLGVLLGALVIDLLVAFVATSFVERRNLVRRVKEM